MGSNVNKFVILVTDASYKINNSHGITSIDDMANILSKKGIITSVIAPASVKELYSSLYETTNGIFADIYGDFSNELMKLADRIGEAVNDGVWILLNNYQYIKLLGEVSSTNGIDTDKDGIGDYSELGEKVEKDLNWFVNFMLKLNGIPEEYYTGKRTVTAYTYKSNPVLVDTDYDGINDSEDENARNNYFNSVLNTSESHSPISYEMDYRAFFRDNSSYSEDLGIVSSIYSSVVYPGNNYGGIDIEEYMEMHGLSDIQRYDLKSRIKPLDNHLSEAYIGHRKVVYKGQEKEILAVFIRGTNGTIEEWTSNFDIGSTEERSRILDYGSIEEKEAIKDWIVSDNHMGFDITANRILRCLREYESEGYVDSSVGKVYWITGHSRGAGIANILGARLIDEGNTVYAYTYASPNTTTKSNANSYKGIFNILNKDDFVPCLPMEVWGFKHYGKNVIISLADNYEKEWEKMTGKFDYNPDSFGMEETIKAMGEIAKDRNECYRYTCVCHGDGTLNNITETIYEISQKFREDAIDKIPTNALSYCKIIREDVDWLSRWKFKICQLPEYFMQVIAAFMVDKEKYKFVIEMNMAPRYQSAKRKICLSALGGLEHPHYVESYYVLSKHISSNQFN